MALVNTVLGPVEDVELGITLPHERLIDDLTAAERPLATGNREIIRGWAVREFEDLLAHGARTVIEVTPIGCGRDVALLRDLQKATRLRLVASTGFGPPGRRPRWLTEKKPKHVAEVFIKELSEGIDGTDSRAGVVSIAVEAIGDEERALLKAVGIAHEKTGAPVIASAPPPVQAALIDDLEEAGVPAHCVALSHAGAGASLADLTALAQRGVSLIFTDWGIAERVADGALVECIKRLQAAGSADRLMISVDFAFRIRRPEAIEWPLYGTPGRTYAYLFRTVLPMMRGAGLTDGDLWQMMVANPAAFLAHGAGEESCRFCAHHH